MGEATWTDQLRDLIGAADRAADAARDIRAWASQEAIGSDALPLEMPETLSSRLTAIERDLGEIGELAGALFARLSVDPSGKLLAGRPLSREQYYLVRALGVDFVGTQELGLTDLSDYEIYRMLCYEDDQRISYINVHLSPRDPLSQRVGGRFGRAPEECRLSCLRPEQVTFFRERCPEIYERFSDR